jgi:NADP-dependent 3-hydroxy acid dehydrogenase YdfG
MANATTFKSVLHSTLDVRVDTAKNTAQLVASINSLKVKQKALANIVQHLHSSPPEVRQKLSPILSRYISPLQATTRSIDSLLIGIGNEISEFCNQVAQQAQLAEMRDSNTALRKIDIMILSNTLSQQAQSVHAITEHAGTQLVNYRNSINATAAQLNTFSQQLQATIAEENREIQQIKHKLYEMQHESIWEKILKAFKELFGELSQNLNNDVRNLRMEEFEIHINQSMIQTIGEVVTDLSGISSVASALQISWRNLSDSIGNLEQDMVGVTANVSLSDWKSDLEYINSDWQNIQQILSNINK